MKVLLLLATIGGLAAPDPAGAACLLIPNATGDATVHCSDGAVGHLHAAPGGALAGMIGAQAVVASSAEIGPPSLAGPPPSVGEVDPRLLARIAPPPPPSIAPLRQTPPMAPPELPDDLRPGLVTARP